MTKRHDTAAARVNANHHHDHHGLSRRQAIQLAIGSIAGSGILFLPSAVYMEAGRNSLLVWVLSTAVCLPMLLMFEDIVRANPPETASSRSSAPVWVRSSAAASR
jgi:amino acid transporter